MKTVSFKLNFTSSTSYNKQGGFKPCACSSEKVIVKPKIPSFPVAGRLRHLIPVWKKEVYKVLLLMNQPETNTEE